MEDKLILETPIPDVASRRGLRPDVRTALLKKKVQTKPYYPKYNLTFQIETEKPLEDHETLFNTLFMQDLNQNFKKFLTISRRHRPDDVLDDVIRSLDCLCKITQLSDTQFEVDLLVKITVVSVLIFKDAEKAKLLEYLRKKLGDTFTIQLKKSFDPLINKKAVTEYGPPIYHEGVKRILLSTDKSDSEIGAPSDGLSRDVRVDKSGLQDPGNDTSSDTDSKLKEPHRASPTKFEITNNKDLEKHGGGSKVPREVSGQPERSGERNETVSARGVDKNNSDQRSVLMTILGLVAGFGLGLSISSQ